MKTIRTNCFETNSSSTHSITIQAGPQNLETPPLSENGILYPARIDDDEIRKLLFKAPTKWSDSREWVFTAASRDTKAALLAQYAYSILDSDDDLNEELLAQVMCTIASYTGYDSIDFGKDFYCRYSISAYSEEIYDTDFETFLDTFARSFVTNKITVDLQRLGLAVQAIVLNDDKVIVDSSEEH